METADLPTYPAEPTATNPENQFLAGTADGLMTGDLVSSSVIALTLTFDTAFSDSNTTDGVAMLRGLFLGTNTSYYYAGILSGTNLGAPLTQTTGTASWPGQLRAVSNSTSATISATQGAGFMLNLTFTADGGTFTTPIVSGTGAIFSYSFDGRFDTSGVMTGTVHNGILTNDGAVDRTNNVYGPGTLTGLIGQDGAVGAFISGHASITSGISARSYAGGFVARPPLPDPMPSVVNTADWLRHFENTGDALPATAEGLTDSAFLSISGAEISTTGTTLIGNISGLTREGDTQDGIRFFRGQIGGVALTQVFAGILPTTNLGAPLMDTAGIKQWAGSFDSFSTAAGAKGVVTFNLTFTDSGGTITGLGTDSGFGDDLDFDLSFTNTGIVTGDMTLYSGAITDANVQDVHDVSGLIGAEGLVGVFVTQASAVAKAAGGFVARPPLPDTTPGAVAFNDWRNSFSPILPTQVPATETESAFLAGLTDGLDRTGLPTGRQVQMTNSISRPEIFRRGEASDPDAQADGYALFHTSNTSDNQNTIGYVGLLSTTNLGAPLTAQPATAIWPGRVSGISPDSGQALDVDFAIDYTNGTIGFSNSFSNSFSSVTNGVWSAPTIFDATLALNGVFGNHADAAGFAEGQIGGTGVYVRTGSNGFTANLEITGLIGQEGLVGVFRHLTIQTRNTVGGFVATNPSP